MARKIVEVRSDLIVVTKGTSPGETTIPREAIDADHEPQPGEVVTDNGDGTWSLGEPQRAPGDDETHKTLPSKVED